MEPLAEAAGAPARNASRLLVQSMPWVFVLIWSTGFVVARFAMPHAPPFSFLAARYALSIACFLVWTLIARVEWPAAPVQWLHLAVVGTLLHAGYLGGVWAAVKAGIGAGTVALIVGLQPVLTALWITLSTRGAGRSGSRVSARVSASQWLGLALGFGGLALVVWHKLGGGEVTFRNLSFAVGHAQLIGALAWSVAVLTLGGSSLLYLLIQRGAATRVTSLMYLVPPCTAVVAWALFGEAVTWSMAVGMLLTVGGVAMVVRSSIK